MTAWSSPQDAAELVDRLSFPQIFLSDDANSQLLFGIVIGDKGENSAVNVWVGFAARENNTDTFLQSMQGVVFCCCFRVFFLSCFVVVVFSFSFSFLLLLLLLLRPYAQTPFSPWSGTVDAEFKVPSVDNPELTYTFAL